MRSLAQHQVQDIRKDFEKVEQSLAIVEGLHEAQLRISRDLDREVWSLLGRMPHEWMRKVFWKEGVRPPILGRAEYEYVFLLGRGKFYPYYTYAYADDFSDPKVVACEEVHGELQIVETDGRASITSSLDVHALSNLVQKIRSALSNLPK